MKENQIQEILKKGIIPKSEQILEVSEDEETKKEDQKFDKHNKSLSFERDLRNLMEEDEKEKNEKFIGVLEEKIHDLEEQIFKNKEEYDQKIQKLKQKCYERKQELADAKIAKVKRNLPRPFSKKKLRD